MRQSLAAPSRAKAQRSKSRHLISLTLGSLCLAAICWLIAAHVHARVGEPTRPEIKLPRQQDFTRERALFLKAETAINKNRTKEAKKLLAQLKGYPLTPYLEYLQLTRNIGNIKAKAVLAYLKHYPNNRFSRRLKSKWLTQLAKKSQWSAFLKHYTPSKSIELQCYYRSALLAKKGSKQALSGIKDLWLVGKSQPKACDRIFKHWEKSKYFRSTYYWDRAYLALQAKQFKLAQFLTKKTATQSDDKRAKAWIDLYRHPERLTQKRYALNNAFDQSLILMGLERLLRRDINDFKAQWQRYRDNIKTNTNAYKKFTHFVARWYSWHYYTDSWQWLTLADPEAQDKELLERRIRLALYHRDWSKVRNWIGALPLDQQNEQAWQYWSARARFELLHHQALALLSQHARRPLPRVTPNGFKRSNGASIGSDVGIDLLSIHANFLYTLLDNSQSFSAPALQQSPAQALVHIRNDLAALATHRSFYGFLASEILQQPLSLNHSPLTLTDQQRWNIEKLPGVQAALEWYRLERLASARSEWLHEIRRLDPQTKSIAAKVAHEWGWHNQAIYTAASSSHKDDLVLRFPLGFLDIVYEQTIEQQIYADWTFALIRQESAFMFDAKSRVGAMGLMQLMPGTAKLVSRRAGEKYPGNTALLDARTNVQAGTRYMASLFKQFKGNLLLATAGYNAGPHRSISWQHPTEAIPGDIWIETVPIQETRDYVKNIMAYQAIYRWHLGRPPRLSSSVERVPPLSETSGK